MLTRGSSARVPGQKPSQGAFLRGWGLPPDDPIKIGETRLGRAVLFHWIESEDTNKIERTWMNTHMVHEGSLPILNKVYSPTFS